jgi:hypothetical protein
MSISSALPQSQELQFPAISKDGSQTAKVVRSIRSPFHEILKDENFACKISGLAATPPTKEKDDSDASALQKVDEFKESWILFQSRCRAVRFFLCSRLSPHEIAEIAAEVRRRRQLAAQVEEIITNLTQKIEEMGDAAAVCHDFSRLLCAPDRTIAGASLQSASISSK